MALARPVALIPLLEGGPELAEIADRAGLSRSYSGEVERGNSTPSLATVLKIAAALGATPSALVEEAERDIRPGGVSVARSPAASLAM